MQLILVDILANNERLTSANDLLQQICDQNEERVEAWFALAYFQRTTLEDFKAARITLQQAIERFPKAEEFLIELAGLEEECGRLEVAEKLLLELSANTADDLTGSLYLSDFYLRNPVFRVQALQLYRHLLVDMHLDDPMIMNNYAYLLVEDSTAVTAAGLEEALLYSTRAVDMEPENTSFLDTIGWIYYRMGKIDLALARLRQALRLSPEEPVILEHLAKVLDETDPEQAELMRRRANEYRRRLENTNELE